MSRSMGDRCVDSQPGSRGLVHSQGGTGPGHSSCYGIRHGLLRPHHPEHIRPHLILEAKETWAWRKKHHGCPRAHQGRRWCGRAQNRVNAEAEGTGSVWGHQVAGARGSPAGQGRWQRPVAILRSLIFIPWAMTVLGGILGAWQGATVTHAIFQGSLSS